VNQERKARVLLSVEEPLKVYGGAGVYQITFYG
jgi:hypothetical protein